MSTAVLMLAVLIIYVPNQGNFPTTFGVMGLNMFNILFLLALFAVMLKNATSRDEQPKPKPHLTNVLIAYYLVLGMSLVLAFLRGSPHPVADIITYKSLVTYSLLYFLAYYGVRNLAQIRFLIIVIVAVFVVASFEAILQGISYGLHDYDDTLRASGPFGEDAGFSNFAGVFYAIFSTFVLAIALLGKDVKSRYRILAAACYVVGCVAILATFSRQAFLAIGVTTLLLTLRKNPVVAVSAVVVMFAYPLWAPEGVVERIEMTSQKTRAGEEVLERSAASRYELWGGAVEIIKRDPWGVGLNQFKNEVEPYLPDWVMARDAQNQYLRFAAEAGVQALIIFLMLLWSFFRLGRRVSRLEYPKEAYALGMAFSISVVAVCLGNVFSSTFSLGEMMANYWVLAGLFSRYAVLAVQESDSRTMVRADSPLGDMRAVYARWQGRHRGEAQ